MFTIVISEKGGAERRESFDKNEINVGRVQGNDLVLPKGNVSKHHARLLFRDARFIVTDLKSTNGTYVNGRKITQATIVREGDKIYIGDFVVRLDTGSGAMAFPPDDASYRTSDEDDSSRDSRDNGGRLPVPREPAPGQPVPQQQAFGQLTGSGAPQRGDDRAPSHYPLERDPDDSDAPPDRSPPAKVPGPPRVPGALTPGQPVVETSSRVPRTTALLAERPQLRPTGSGTPAIRPTQGTLAGGSMAQATTSRGLPPSPAAGAVAAGPMSSGGAPNANPAPNARPAAIHATTPTPASQIRRDATALLVRRAVQALGEAKVEAAVLSDQDLRADADRTVREQAKKMRDANEIPESVEADVIARDAIAEIAGLGPFESLLDDEDVLEASAIGLDSVTVVRQHGFARSDLSFSSAASLDRAVRRLAARADDPVKAHEVEVSRTLRSGVRVSALLSSGASAGVLTVWRSQKLDATLDDLVRQGALSKAIASFLEQVLAGAGRVLVVGGRGNGASLLAAAFAHANEGSPRALIVEGGADLSLAGRGISTLALSGDDRRDALLLRAATKTAADPVVIDGLRVALASALVDATQDSSSAFLVTMHANSLRQALARLVSGVATANPGIGVPAAQEAIAGVFDVAVEVADVAESKWRVIKVAELGGTDASGVSVRDVFTSGGDAAAADGGFLATGVTPKLVAEFAQRGIRIDTNLFRRGR